MNTQKSRVDQLEEDMVSFAEDINDLKDKVVALY